ncbi:MAG: zinc ribbon domain-containing protein [bacterium]
MNEQLKRLIELQEVDSLLDSIRGEIDQIPKEIDRLKTEFEESQASLEELKKNMAQLQVARRNKELELKTTEEELKKHQSELFTIKTNEAYTALLKEIEAEKKLKNEIEDTVLTVMEEEDVLLAKEKIKKEEIAKKKEAVTRGQKELQDKLQRLNQNLQEVESEQKQKIASIGPEIFKSYQRIREKKDGVAVVPIVDGFCGGCSIVLPTQLVNDVLRGEELVACRNCLRILYLKEEK